MTSYHQSSIHVSFHNFTFIVPPSHIFLVLCLVYYPVSHFCKISCSCLPYLPIPNNSVASLPSHFIKSHDILHILFALTFFMPKSFNISAIVSLSDNNSFHALGNFSKNPGKTLTISSCLIQTDNTNHMLPLILYLLLHHQIIILCIQSPLLSLVLPLFHHESGHDTCPIFSKTYVSRP